MISHLLFGIGIIVFSLFLGMAGYHYFEEMDWVNSYENAAMILSGMGPVDPVKTVNSLSELTPCLAGLYF